MAGQPCTRMFIYLTRTFGKCAQVTALRRLDQVRKASLYVKTDVFAQPVKIGGEEAAFHLVQMPGYLLLKLGRSRARGQHVLTLTG